MLNVLPNATNYQIQASDYIYILITENIVICLF